MRHVIQDSWSSKQEHGDGLLILVAMQIWLGIFSREGRDGDARVIFDS